MSADIAQGSHHEVVIVGDGPAGRALGAACFHAGVDALVVGSDEPWRPTYAAWADEVAVHHHCAAATMEIDVVGTPPRRRLDRHYLVFDNERLAKELDLAPRLTAHVTDVHHHSRIADVNGQTNASVLLVDGRRLHANLVVDATGPQAQLLVRRRSAGPSYQSAYGLVVDARPDVGGDAAVLMDWRSPSNDFRAEPTFMYLVEVGGGRWLVEETSLARRTPMPADELRRRLAARIGRDLTPVADQVEHVVIPMWTGVPDRHQPTIGFGAAAGFVHPATGYSVAASLNAAPRVAAALRAALDDGGQDAASMVWDAVWPADLRRARAVHDYGQAALLRLRTHEVQVFFDAFFDAPTDVWSAYLRMDTTAAGAARAMAAMFSSVPWSLRRRLAAGNPKALAQLLR